MVHGWTNGAAPKTIRFGFRPNSTSNPTVVRDPFDFVDTIVCNQAGRWTVTLKDAYKFLVGAQIQFRIVSAADLVPQLSTVLNENSATPLSFIIRALAGATETDIASNADNWIYVTLEFEDTDASGLS